MIITRFLLLAAAGFLTICLGACSDASNTAANKPARKVYYAHDVQTGSHLQRAYVDPNEATANDSGQLTGTTGAGQHPFVGNSAGGSYAGAR